MTQRFVFQPINFGKNVADMTDDVGEKLRMLRVQRSLSQENVSDYIGVSLSSYQRYESGKVGIDITVMGKLATLYDTSIDSILKIETDPTVAKEAPSDYGRPARSRDVEIVVKLDGTEGSLEAWVTKLTAINKVL